MQQPAPTPALRHLDTLVGEWSVEGTHVSDPTTSARGLVSFEWILGGAFIIQRTRAEQPVFPDSDAIIGMDDETGSFKLYYFDTRGVTRIYEMTLSDGVWKVWRDAPGFSQRFTGTFEDDGNAIHASWELSTDGSHWDHDLGLTYTRLT